MITVTAHDPTLQPLADRFQRGISRCYPYLGLHLQRSTAWLYMRAIFDAPLSDAEVYSTLEAAVLTALTDQAQRHGPSLLSVQEQP